ncbi:MAG: Rab family GTPase [Candidatus Hodarchaeota archaeon]
MRGCLTPKRILFVGQSGSGKTTLLNLAAQSFSCILTKLNTTDKEQESMKAVFLELEEPKDDIEREKWKYTLSLIKGGIVFIIDGSSETGWGAAKRLLNDLTKIITPTTPVAIVINKIDIASPDFSELFEFLDFQDLLEIFEVGIRIFHTSSKDAKASSQFLDWIGEQICLFPRLDADELLQVLVFRSSGLPIAYIGPIKEDEPVWQDALLTAAYAALDLFTSFIGDGSRIKTLDITSPDLDPRLLRVAGLACEPVRLALITRGIAPEQVLRFGEAVAEYFREKSASDEEGKTVRYSISGFFQLFSELIGSGCPCSVYMPNN